MKILLIGSGGREHALAWKLNQSPLCSGLFIVPGNAGTSSCGTNIGLEVTNFEGIQKLVMDNKIEMVVVGPEEPLVAGIHDFFLSDPGLKDIPVIGPQKNGAMLEASKDFSKQFMRENGIPTALYRSFNKETLSDGLQFLETLNPPYVLKADGLAAGKGVIILEELQKAKDELIEILAGDKFGSAGNKVVIEEFLNGIELSVFILTDGNSFLLLPEAKDYKRAGEGDSGLNTGGMGAVSPVPFADETFMKKVVQRIIEPTLDGLRKRGIEYSGFIFFGLMKVKDDPYVIEYNVRLGDPETEVVIPRIQNDLIELFQATAHGKLGGVKLEVDPRSATAIMLVSGGYPGKYKKGMEVTGLQNSGSCHLFHSGTVLENQKVLTCGGRVMAVTGLGQNLGEALKSSLQMAAQISFIDKYYRRDIGKDLLEMQREKKLFF